MKKNNKKVYNPREIIPGWANSDMACEIYKNITGHTCKNPQDLNSTLRYYAQKGEIDINNASHGCVLWNIESVKEFSKKRREIVQASIRKSINQHELLLNLECAKNGTDDISSLCSKIEEIIKNHEDIIVDKIISKIKDLIG